MMATVSEALLAIGRERSMTATFRQIVEAVRRLGSAQCAAIGIRDERGFASFITSGMSEAMLAEIGHLPAPTGLLLAVIQEAQPLRVPLMAADPRAADMPPSLVDLGAFMGIPLASEEGVVGAFYLFGRDGAPSFTAADYDAVQMLASHALLAVENARLNERSRELTVVEERNRLARELHDAVSQTLFSVVLTAGSAAALINQDPEAACRHLADLQDLAQEAQKEMRSLIFELRPAEIEGDGLASTLRKHIDVLRRVHSSQIELTVTGDRSLAPHTEREIFRIAQEALSNALKHAGAARILVGLATDASLVSLRIQDDGKGFDPIAAGGKAKRLGLTSMRERVDLLGGTITIDSSPGQGTTVVVQVPDGR